MQPRSILLPKSEEPIQPSPHVYKSAERRRGFLVIVLAGSDPSHSVSLSSKTRGCLTSPPEATLAATAYNRRTAFPILKAEKVGPTGRPGRAPLTLRQRHVRTIRHK